MAVCDEAIERVWQIVCELPEPTDTGTVVASVTASWVAAISGRAGPIRDAVLEAYTDAVRRALQEQDAKVTGDRSAG